MKLQVIFPDSPMDYQTLPFYYLSRINFDGNLRKNAVIIHAGISGFSIVLSHLNLFQRWIRPQPHIPACFISLIALLKQRIND